MFRCLFKGHAWGKWKPVYERLPFASFIGLVDGSVRERQCDCCGKWQRNGKL